MKLPGGKKLVLSSNLTMAQGTANTQSWEWRLPLKLQQDAGGSGVELQVTSYKLTRGYAMVRKEILKLVACNS